MPKKTPKYPQTIDAAVDRLIEILPLKDKVGITRMDEMELLELQLSMGVFIRTEFGLLTGNKKLLAACDKMQPGNDSDQYIACSVIIKALWQRLQSTHMLKRVK